MIYVSLDEAAAQLPQLIQRMAEGEQIVLTQNAVPVAQMVPFDAARRPRQPGSAKGQILYMAEDFDAPLPDFESYS